MPIRIVTDSTCDLPQEVIQKLGISVIPFFINIADEGFLDGIEITREDFYTNLPDYPAHPTTAIPGTRKFKQVYQTLVAEGATEILSIHISESLSGALSVAQSAAREFKQLPVTVLDSRQLSLGTGFQVEIAARMANEGHSLPEILSALSDIMSRTYVTAALKTLKYLRRSGRMGPFMTGLGSLLQIKPILTMQNGHPGSERVRTTKKAERRLIEILAEKQPIERFALLHTNAPKEAAAFHARILDLIPVEELYIFHGYRWVTLISKNPILN